MVLRLLATGADRQARQQPSGTALEHLPAHLLWCDMSHGRQS